LIRASILVLDAVERLRFGRALVRRILERVAVLVGGGTTRSSRVRRRAGRRVRARVGRVGNAVFVVVRIGAAVCVLEAVDVFRLIGALVDLVGNAILVLVGAAVDLRIRASLARFIRARVLGVEDAVLVVVRIGTTVCVLEAVGVFLLGGTLVFGVADAVIVVVPVGATVRILKAVPVLCKLGALIDVVLHAVVVGVVLARRPPSDAST